MNRKQRKKLRSAIRRVPLGIVAIQTLALPAALAQTATNQPSMVTNSPPSLLTNTQPAIKLEETVVTGRLTPTADTIGPAPMQTITSEDIEKAGTTDVLNTLLKFNPLFYGVGNSLGQNNNNNSPFNGQPTGTGESFAALRNLPTLILIDGRRMVSSPLSGGQGVDLNLIPISMVDRIEVLQDGASALYGSDAIGGVINIITKKDYNGWDVDARIGFPTDETSNHFLQYQTSIVGGMTTENTRLVIGAQYFHTDPLKEEDRINSSPTALLNAGLLPVGANSSPTYPGRIDDVDGSYVLAGSPFAAGAPGFQPGLTTPPIVPGGPFTSVAAYNAAAIKDPQVGFAPYIPLASTPLGQINNSVLASEDFPFFNAAQFGTYSLLKQDRDNVSINLDHDLFDKSLTLFTDFMFAHDETQAELGPTPGPFLEQANVIIPANNPFNPFGIDLGGPVNPPNIRTRFIDSGNRIYDTTSDSYHAIAGAKGILSPDYSYEFAGNYSREDQQYLIHNAINGVALNQALTPNGQVNGQGQPLSMLKDANGNPVPVFNYFDLGANSPATLNAISTIPFQEGYSDLWSLDAKIIATPAFLELPAGPVAIALGGEVIGEDLNTTVDALTQAGEVPGINQTFPTSGSRQRFAAFTEINIPIFSKDASIPGFHSLELTVAGRFEAIQPGGNTAVPKLGLLWQPVDDQFTLRSSYSGGFVAPSIFSLFGPNSVSEPPVSLPDGTAQEEIITTSNPKLKPSSSQQWNSGIVISPKAIPGLTVSADFYHVQENHVAVADYTSALTSLNALGSASPFAGDYIRSDGSSLTTTAPNQVLNANFGTLTIPLSDSEAVRTEGFDFDVNYSRPITWGTVTLKANINWTLNYEVQAAPGTPYYHYEGQGTYGFGTAQGIIPDFNVNCSLNWDYKNFRYVASAHYLPGVTIPGDLFPSVTSPGATQGSTLNGLAQHVGSYYTLDMQVSYVFGGSGKVNNWRDGLRFTLGCDNITDTPAPLIAGGPDDYSDKNVYDLLGRFVYVEVSKKF